MRVIVSLLLSVLLAACSLGGQVSQSVVKQAIALQFRQIQQEIVQQLTTSPDQVPSFKLDRVAIAQQDRFTVSDLPTYHVKGTYRLTLQFPRHRVVEPDTPFDIYVQQQREGKTWRLLRPIRRPDADQVEWATYLIPMG